MNGDLASHPNTRRVLLTGANGKIGSRILDDLRSRYEMIPTDLGESTLPGYLRADLTKFEETFRLMQNIDTVVHLAVATGEGKQTSLPPEVLDPVEDRMLKVNPASVHNVLEAAARQGVRRVVYISSLTILLADKNRSDFPHDMQPDPTNLYACTKLFGEQFAFVKWRDSGLSTICLRMGQPTPIGSPWDNAWQNNRRARSWRVHLVDVVAGISAAIESRQSFGVYSLVSESDNPRVDLSASRRDLGYKPRAWFGERCLTINGQPQLLPC